MTKAPRSQMDEADRDLAREKAKARYHRSPAAQRKRAYRRALGRIRTPRASTLKRHGLATAVDDENDDSLYV